MQKQLQPCFLKHKWAGKKLTTTSNLHQSLASHLTPEETKKLSPTPSLADPWPVNRQRKVSDPEGLEALLTTSPMNPTGKPARLSAPKAHWAGLAQIRHGSPKLSKGFSRRSIRSQDPGGKPCDLGVLEGERAQGPGPLVTSI